MEKMIGAFSYLHEEDNIFFFLISFILVSVKVTTIKKIKYK